MVRQPSVVLSGCVLAVATLAGQTVTPRAPWTPAQVKAVLDRTARARLAPDLSRLTPGERQAVAKLLQVGLIFQDIYEDQRHRSAIAARTALENAPDPSSQDLLALYRLNQGPIATTLDNKREPFLAVDPAPPGKNVYPSDLTDQEFQAFIAAHPADRRPLTHLRSVVRRANAATVSRDLAALTRHPVLDMLHPGLKAKLAALSRTPDAKTLYGLPYSVAYADHTVRAYGLLQDAAAAVDNDDEEFARFLRNRARDLLTDDYEAGDASWITGHFTHLNAQIGAYETYDDELLGTRAFYGLSLLATRTEESAALRKALQGIQALEDSLPTDRHKRVIEDIPVGLYDVIADFGQARGGNTATNLPNEPYLAARYGSIILLRANIMRDPDIFSGASRTFSTAVAPEFRSDLTADGTFYRTLWHEIGHYLGPDVTRDGRDFDAALGADASLLEEMKADLVSLFVAPELKSRGYFTETQLRAVYASGILRVLQSNRPRREQPYNMMQLMQWNWFLDKGLLRFNTATSTLSIDHSRYHDAVRDLLKEVIANQDAWNKTTTAAFIERWGTWDENLHGRIASALRDQQQFRFRLFEYQALETLRP